MYCLAPMLYRYIGATILLFLTNAWLVTSAYDSNTILTLAKQRYSEESVELVLLWQNILEKAKPLPVQERLSLINQFFNTHIFFGNDQNIWNSSDYWATPLETMGKQQGDCEDFTIAKYMSLRMLGIPNRKLRLMYVKAKIKNAKGETNQAHMVLAYYPSDAADPLILDNLITTIKPATQRKDLTPIFGFNSEGLWISGTKKLVVKKPETRLSRWRDLLSRMQQDGYQ